jgi:4-carboxymuconolactone decarboxylase
VEGYGKVLSRPGLDLAARELCVVALLAPQDAAPQLYSHLRGALNAGAATTDVDEAVRIIDPLLPTARRHQLQAQWSAVLERRGTSSGGG